MRIRRELAVVSAAAAALFTVIWLLIPSYPGYDTYYHLVWGRELFDGTMPGYVDYIAPTPHPLYLLLMAVIGLIGDAADRVAVLISLLSFAAVVTAIYLLSRVLFDRFVAAVSALMVGFNLLLLLYALHGYLDLPYLAFICWAVAVAVAKPQWRYTPLLLLGVAGLLRPEAWPIAICYGIWRGWHGSSGERIRLALAAFSAPLLWCLTDLIVTGNPLFSLTSTSDLAAELERETGLMRVPAALVENMLSLLKPPLAVLALAGVLVALKLRGFKAVAVPLVLIAVTATTFAANGLFGLTLLPRYLLVPAVISSVFAAYALVGFFTLTQRPKLRRYWSAAAVMAVVAALPFVYMQRSTAARIHSEFEFVTGVHRSLEQITATPQFKRGLSCGPVSLPTYRLVPDLRWITGLPQGRVLARSNSINRTGLVLVIRTPRATGRFARASGIEAETNYAPQGFTAVAENYYFQLYLRCPR